jgi:hypothetical protein
VRGLDGGEWVNRDKSIVRVMVPNSVNSLVWLCSSQYLSDAFFC